MCDIKTGSPLLVEGHGLPSWIIRLGGIIGMGSRSKVTHIEMLLWAPDFCPAFREDFGMESDEFYTLKSTSQSKVKDTRDRDFINGVSITRLRSFIDAEPGRIWTRGMNKKPSKDDINLLEELIREIYRRPYEHNLVELAAAALDRTSYRSGEDHSSLFCSEIYTWIFNLWRYSDETDNEIVPSNYEWKVIFGRGRKMYGIMPIEEALL